MDSNGYAITGINDVATANICGIAANDLGKFDVKIVARHNDSSLTLNFLANLANPADDQTFGIRNINILLSSGSVSPSTTFCL